MAERTDVLLYGAYGYTGRLITEEAVQAGIRPILAGRNSARVEAVAREFGLPWVAFEITDAHAIREALSRVQVAINCAGPFRHTFTPFIDACIDTGVHYLDVTGEIDVFHRAAARHADLINAGIMAMPGVGFDIVPSDYLASYAKTRLPCAQRMVMAVGKVDAVSRGTATTVLDQLGRPGLARVDGRIVEVSTAWHQRHIDFGNGPELCVTAPLADVFSAHYTTGIPNIECYLALPCPVSGWALKLFHPILKPTWLQAFLRRRLARMKQPGPNPDQRAVGRSVIYVEAESTDGNRIRAVLRGPEPYTMTASVAVAALKGVLAGRAKPGFQTPTPVFGIDLISACDIEIEDLE